MTGQGQDVDVLERARRWIEEGRQLGCELQTIVLEDVLHSTIAIEKVGGHYVAHVAVIRESQIADESYERDETISFSTYSAAEAFIEETTNTTLADLRPFKGQKAFNPGFASEFVAHPLLEHVESYAQKSTDNWRLEVFRDEQRVSTLVGSDEAATVALQEIFVECAVRAAGLATSTWNLAFPDTSLPPGMLGAARDWLHLRDDLRAEALANYQPTILALAQKHWKTRPGNPAWVGRGLAWMCDAPMHGWQGFPATLAFYRVCDVTRLNAILHAAFQNQERSC